MVGKLNTYLLKLAYSQGYFPMPEPLTGEILWYKPDPRAIIPLNGFHVSRSLRRKINKNIFDITMDKDFLGVMKGCANRPETWINNEFLSVYHEMFKQGMAHSVEISLNGKLVGGTYGVCLGGAFFAESKFHIITDASKIALFYLVEYLREKEFILLEVQFLTPHLKSLVAIEIPIDEYLNKLELAVSLKDLWNS